MTARTSKFWKIPRNSAFVEHLYWNYANELGMTNKIGNIQNFRLKISKRWKYVDIRSCEHYQLIALNYELSKFPMFQNSRFLLARDFI